MKRIEKDKGGKEDGKGQWGSEGKKVEWGTKEKRQGSPKPGITHACPIL